MRTLADDLESRGSPLEYWFIKVHAGDLAFLVDFIARRAIGRAEVRVSLWVRGRGRVARSRPASWRADAVEVTMGESAFGPDRCRGAVEDISWDLTYEAGSARAAPTVPLLSRLRAFDLSLVSRPCALFDGQVTVAGERFDLAAAKGSVTHYWGRRLPDRWHWISANSFGNTDLTLESVVFRTRLWGARPALRAGYLWTREDGRERLLVSPLNGLITVAGTPTDYTLTARAVGRTIRVRCSAGPEAYNDLGEGIRQTLLGTCVEVERGRSDSRAGLEYRHRDRRSGLSGAGPGRV